MGELCYGCFSQMSQPGTCPRCGYNAAAAEARYPSALKGGTVLKNRYVLGRVMGQGGFGITYAALDMEAGIRVAVKEYMPEIFAGRDSTGRVTAHSAQKTESFNHGKMSFLDEANALVALKSSPSIVNIHDYFEMNGTAYFVMEFVQGTNLKSYVKMMGGNLGEEEANRILLPIMEALQDVHSKGLIHRDIAPDNIIVSSGGSAKLIDFGAARYSTGEKSLSLDVVLKHGYAPKEQYMRKGRQGPFTDVYAMGATYYYAVTGRTPPDAVDRLEEDSLIPPSALGVKLSENVEKAVLKALEVLPADRFQSMSEFVAAIKGAAPATQPGADNRKANPAFIPRQQPAQPVQPPVQPVQRPVQQAPQKAPRRVSKKPVQIQPPPANAAAAPGQPSKAPKPTSGTPLPGGRGGVKVSKPFAIGLFAVVAIVFAIVVFSVNGKGPKYDRACEYLNDGYYDRAYSTFISLGDYSDSPAKAREAMYRKADALMAAGSYEEAYDELSSINTLGDKENRLDNCVLRWAEYILDSASKTQAEKFKSKVLLENYQQKELYKVLTGYIDAHPDYNYWADTGRTAAAEILFGTLPSDYKDSEELRQLFSYLTDGTIVLSGWGGYTIRSYRDYFHSMWGVSFMRDYLTSDLNLAVFLEGHWDTADKQFAFDFKEEKDGGTTNWTSLPRGAQPYGTKYYDFVDGVFVWLDENFNPLGNVYEITVVDIDVIEVLAYANNITYTLYRK